LSAKSETNIRVGEVFYPSQSPYSNFKLSIDVELIEGISARPNYGIFFRYTSDNDNYYSFQLNDGFYAFFINFGETFEPIIDWRPNSIIKPNGENHITVIAVGSEFTFIINDEVVATVQDDRLSKGKLGVEFQIGEGETLIEFDNLKIWVPGDSKYNNPINSITPTNETN